MFKRYTSTLLLLLASLELPAITLEEYVHDTLQAHPTVRQQLHIYRQDIQDFKISQGFWHPTVDVTASAGTYSDKTPTLSNTRTDYESWEAELTVVQNLYDGHQTENQKIQALARINASKYQLIDEVDNTALIAIKAYLTGMKQRDLVILAEENMDTHISMIRDIQDRYDLGVGKRSEVEEIDARVASARASLLAAQNNFEDSLTEMQHVLGRYVHQKELEEINVPPFLGSFIQEIIDGALLNNPGLKVAKYNIEAAQADYDGVIKSHRPILDLKLKKKYGDNVSGILGETDNLSLTLEMRYNIYNGYKDEAEQVKKISSIYEQQAYAQQAQRQTINSLRLAWVADRSLAKQTVFLNRNETVNFKVLASYLEEFDLGQRTLTDILNVKSDLNDAQKRLVVAKYDSYEARFRVLEATGELFKPLLIDINVTDGNLKIASHNANKVDQLPLNSDHDDDGELDRADHCDNTLKAQKVDQYGCQSFLVPDFSYLIKNVPPTGEDDFVTLEANQVSRIFDTTLLANDTDANKNDELVILEFTQPENGKIARSDDGKSLIYQPNEGFIGEDFFKYSLRDSQGSVSNATVFVTVIPEKVRGKLVVNYQYEKDKLTDKSRRRLESYMKTINWDDYEKVEINAYTDFIGKYSSNQKLSMKRAKELKSLLVSSGAKEDDILAYGWGESNPIAKNGTDFGRAINRRAELIFTIKPEFDTDSIIPKKAEEKNWKAIKIVEFIPGTNNLVTHSWKLLNKYTQNLIAGKQKNIKIELNVNTKGMDDSKAAKELAKLKIAKIENNLLLEGFIKENITSFVWDKSNQLKNKGSIAQGNKTIGSDFIEIRFHYEN